jgi:hypothetical protein
MASLNFAPQDRLVVLEDTRVFSAPHQTATAAALLSRPPPVVCTLFVSDMFVCALPSLTFVPFSLSIWISIHIAGDGTAFGLWHWFLRLPQWLHVYEPGDPVHLLLRLGCHVSVRQHPIHIVLDWAAPGMQCGSVHLSDRVHLSSHLYGAVCLLLRGCCLCMCVVHNCCSRAFLIVVPLSPATPFPHLSNWVSQKRTCCSVSCWQHGLHQPGESPTTDLHTWCGERVSKRLPVHGGCVRFRVLYRRR